MIEPVPVQLQPGLLIEASPGEQIRIGEFDQSDAILPVTLPNLYALPDLRFPHLVRIPWFGNFSPDAVFFLTRARREAAFFFFYLAAKDQP